MDAIARIDEARRELDVLRHPFYLRWSAGELSAEELGVYAGQYRHAVVALADACDRAAAHAEKDERAALRRHALEERSHIGLWDAFAQASGAPEEHPLTETERCAQSWKAGESLLEHLAVLYAIEASQPAIARTKLEGLLEHYGYSPEGPAVEYFELHATLDVEHARHSRELIESALDADAHDAHARVEAMVERAIAALRGNWSLLDGVHARFASSA